MIRKTFGMLAVAALVLSTSCKNENASDKIDQANVDKTMAENATTGKLPVVEFDKMVHDFGNISDAEKVETTFTIKNTGEADLIIINAQGSCGCTVPDYPKEPVKPGESAPMKVTFDPHGKTGNVEKTVTLTTNSKEGSEKVTVKASITPKAGATTTPAAH
jgi:uncharacterized protein DUF1573